MSILYVFYTHEKMLNHTQERVEKMMINQTKDYLIVCGDIKSDYDKNLKVLKIDCNDKYEGLTEKILKSFNYLTECENFKNFDYFVKLDEDMIIDNVIPEKVLINVEYCGKVQISQGNRKYHFGKFSKENPNYDKPYPGAYVPWCLGGYGYIISRRAINIIKKDPEFKSAMLWPWGSYEDVYISILLNKNGIFPKKFNTRSFFKSPVHI